MTTIVIGNLFFLFFINLFTFFFNLLIRLANQKDFFLTIIICNGSAVHLACAVRNKQLSCIFIYLFIYLFIYFLVHACMSLWQLIRADGPAKVGPAKLIALLI